MLYHYKFTLAMENSVDESYTTEKLWQALKMGTVPIYWGASNVRELLPDPNAVLMVEDFASLEGAWLPYALCAGCSLPRV